MKKELNINLTIDNKTIYSFVAIGIFILISVSVFAYGTSTPSSFGHSAGELDLSAGVVEDVVFNGDVLIAGEIKIGVTSEVCNSNIEGSLRYNSVDKIIEYCDGVEWK